MGKALIIKGANFSSIAVGTIEIDIATPIISISLAGQVTITSEYDVYYTTDGATPTKQSTKYTAPFSVNMNTVVKAVAFSGNIDSDVASETYDGTVLAPTIDITDRGVVTITNNTQEATVYYTTNGATPTSSSTQYTASFTVEDGVIVKAIAIYGQLSSSVSSETAVVLIATFGKKFTLVGGEPSGALTDDSTRYVSPKITIPAGTSYTIYSTQAAYGVDFVVEYNSSNTRVEFWNLVGGGAQTGTITKTAKSSTTYLRFSGLVGSQYSGAYAMVGGVKVWEYDGSTE